MSTMTVKEQALNTYIRRPLGRIWAGFAGVDAAEYFKIDEAAKEAPKVDFTGNNASGADTDKGDS